MPEEFRIALFDGVWEGIRDSYVDPETNGLDWEAIGDEYAPLIIATDNAYEVYELLREMVALLDDPYTDFFAPEDLGDPAVVDPELRRHRRARRQRRGRRGQRRPAHHLRLRRRLGQGGRHRAARPHRRA